MMTLRARFPMIASCASLVLSFGLCAGEALGATTDAGDVPYSTPPGVTIVDVANGRLFGSRRLGDAQGNPVFALKPNASGKVVCDDACAQDFTPLVATAGASAFDVWTLVNAQGDAKQWAYQGQPLYRYKGSRPIDRIVTPKGEDAPAAYWHVVAFRPQASVQVPAGIKVHSLEVGAGYGLSDSESGAVMYHLSGAPKSPGSWLPVYAPAVALPVGDFTVIKREDRSRQWAYKGNALYVFRGDYSPDDINGVYAEPAARPALVVKHYMPANVQIQNAITHGPVMVTSEGRSVYTEGQYKLQYGGRSTRDGYYLPYTNAKQVGVQGCVKDCLKTWQPVVAPADAEARGFWEIANRDDGTRQWVYKGAALYTYADDKQLGDLYGNNRHVIIYGDSVNDSVDLTPSGGSAAAVGEFERGFGSGYYWHYVMLYTQSVDRDNSTAKLDE